MNFTFTPVNDPSLNAFALPDGTVVVDSGLLAALENEAQLATVLGHEIPWRDIGVIFSELRDVKRAGQAFEKYLELAPDAPEGPQIRAFLDVLKNR